MLGRKAAARGYRASSADSGQTRTILCARSVSCLLHLERMRISERVELEVTPDSPLGLRRGSEAVFDR